MDYEKKLLELEELVAKLESSDTTLSEGVKLFESGVNITKECLEVLSEYKGKIALVQDEVDKLLSEIE